MTRGIYPVSGLRLTPTGKLRRRGYYHAYTHELFKPKWWPISVPKFLQSKLGETTYDRDVTRAFPVPTYKRNEKRYLKPVTNCNDPSIQEYLLNSLEPSYRRTFSGIGMGHNSKFDNIKHIKRIADIENGGMIDLDCDSTDFQMGNDNCEIKLLKDLVEESDIWSTVNNEKKTSKTPFPHVYENLPIVKTLQIHEIKHVRSDHRMICRRHQIWMNRKYYRFVEKIKFQNKLKQIEEENV